MRKYVMAAALFLAAGPAFAAERDYCPERPGLGNPACTMAPGRVSVETGLADWQRDDDGDTREDVVTLGDTLVRIGLSDTIEAQLGWTPYAHVRTRDKATGAIEKAGRVGDMLLGMKANLHNPDGSGFSAALQPFVTVPVGRQPAGTGDWGAGLIAPVTYDLNDSLNLEFTSEIDAAVDEDGKGRHLAYSGTIGIAADLSDTLSGTAEFQAARDDDPSDHSTALFGALSFGWMASDAMQLDVGATFGLNHAATDTEIYAGISRRF